MKIIEITKGKSVKVDDDDFEWLSGFNWRADAEVRLSRNRQVQGFRITASYHIARIQRTISVSMTIAERRSCCTNGRLALMPPISHLLTIKP